MDTRIYAHSLYFCDSKGNNVVHIFVMKFVCENVVELVLDIVKLLI